MWITKDPSGEISNITSSDERSGVVDELKRLGDLAVDLIIAGGHSGAIFNHQ